MEQPQAFQPQARRNEQWTVDPFWEVDRSQRQPPRPEVDPGLSSRQPQHTPTEEGEIGSKTDRDPSALEVSAVNWAKYVVVKGVQYTKMGLVSKVDPEEHITWDLGNAVKATEKHFATDLQLLKTETTNDPSLLKTPVCLERQQHDKMPDEDFLYKQKLSTRYGLVFYEDWILVPKNLRNTVISLLHKGHPAINKMSKMGDNFGGHGSPKPYRCNAIAASLAKCPVRTSNLIYLMWKKHLPPLSKPNERIQLDFIGPITEKNHTFYILLSMDHQFSKWPAASLFKTTEGQTAVRFWEQYTNLNGVPKPIRTDKATAFAGRLFTEFCKNLRIKSIYATPYTHAHRSS